MATAYQTNPSLLASRAQLRATDEGIQKALSGWRPTVTLSGSAGRARDEGYFLNPATQAGMRELIYRNPRQGGINLDQPIMTFGRVEADLNRSEQLVLDGRARLDIAEQNMLIDVVTAYTDVLRDQEVVDLERGAIDLYTRQRDAARARLERHDATTADVAQAESRLAQAFADLHGAEAKLETSRNAYTKVVGTPPGTLIEPKPLGNLPLTDEEVRARAENQPNVRSARFVLAAAEQDIRVAEAERWPKLDLQGSLSRSSGYIIDRRDDRAEITLALTVPLYQQGLVDAREREARQTYVQRARELENARREALELANSTWQNLIAARSRVTDFEEQRRAAIAAARGVEAEYRLGERTLLNVLDAQREALQAQISLEQAQRDVVVTSYQMAAAVGDLSAKRLNLDTKLYDPTVHYNETRDRWFGLGGGIGTEPVMNETPTKIPERLPQ